MELKFKRLKDSAVLPIRGTKGAAGIDLTCTNITTTLNEANQLMLVYHTDLAVEIPKGYVGLLVPRSSIWKKSLMLTDSLGIIDSDFRGEIVAIMKATTDTVPAIYKQGERFCQLVILKKPEYTIKEVEELSKTERGEGGFGSTGTTNEDIKTFSAATGSETQASEQFQTAPEPAAAQDGAEVSGGQA
nr:MAG TPA: dUTPase [Caudoviricetes sp.]